MNPKHKQVFITYSRNNVEQADAVCAHLESANIQCWIAPRDISPSKDWAEEIIDAINSVDVMVLIFSSYSNTSPQVRREVERAVHKGLNVLTFRIEDVIPSKSLEYFISTQHWLDASSGPFDKHLDMLHSCVNALVKDGSDEKSTRKHEPVLEETNSRANPFSVSELKYISVQLANYLGPMAKIIVKKKAMQSKSLKELIDISSDELDDHIERTNFIEACMSIVDSTSP
jgi:hypothetical protein